MPILSLYPHPDSRSPGTGIEVEAAWRGSHLLRLTYRLSSPLDQIAIPPPLSASRADELWRHTCFEAFIGADKGYYELNFSPSSQWAAYRFDSHRAGKRDAVVAVSSIEWHAENGEGRLTATVDLPPDATGPLGLSAVIEYTDGTRSYWALAFPPGQPDFHHAACFAAELPSAG